MNDDYTTSQEPDPAAEAFFRLEGELALMRRGVEQMAREKADIVIPDYSATLGEMAQNIARLLRELQVIAAKPAMTLTPEDLAQRIDDAARQARQTDHAELRGAHDRFDHASRELKTLVASAYAAREQHCRLLWAASGGLIAGCLLWSILPGVIVRALPQSWHIPEGMAAHVLGEPTLWEAGSRLMKADSPQTWRALTQAAEMLRDNRQAIVKCREAANKVGKPVRCPIIVHV